MKQFLKENTTSISTVINPSAIDDEVNETRRSKPPEEMNVAEKTVEALANVFRQAKSCTLGLFT